MFEAGKRNGVENPTGFGTGEGFGDGVGKTTLAPTTKATAANTPVKTVVSSQAMLEIKAGKNTRTTVGLGETVTFYAEQDSAGSGIGVDGSWSSTIGKSAPNAADGNMLWTAPDAAGDGGVTFTPKDGGTATTIKMKVVAPASLKFAKKDEIKYTAGTQGAGMHLDVSLEPNTVSFANMKWKEGKVGATNITGYYAEAKKPPQDHVPAAVPPTFNNDNEVKDAKGIGGDTAEFFGADKPWAEGGYDWVIPQAIVNNGTEIPLGTVLQTCRLQADGTTTTTKNGVEVKRKP